MSLRDKRVLVTGASGFIGGRLAVRLALEEGAMVTGTGRSLKETSLLQEAGVRFRQADITDSAAMRELVSGQEVIFHVAAATGRSSRDLEISRRVNVLATESLVRAAAQAGATRFVHVSSIAAYGPPEQGFITEEHSPDTRQRAPYGRTKAQGELLAMRTASELGLGLVVIRPGQVFGPRGKTWTVNALKLVQKRVPVVFGGGNGHAQPIYIDNLTDGMILAATQSKAAGETFNFVDQPLAWRDFFAFYASMCGRKLVELPLWMAQLAVRAFALMSGRSESPDDLLRFYTARSVYPTAKAECSLGYRPRITIEEGMRRTEAWLRETGYLPPAIDLSAAAG